ncbi:hypothetical protein [Streptomyces mirabilis]|uniref:hypothetical protein n=1 Tax=Streptomyces mirabilis TaxID=68239 RepID=UPI003697218A
MTTDPQLSLRAVFTVTVETRKGAAYFDRDGFVLHAVSRIEGALESSDDIRDVIVVEAEPAAPVPPSAPTNRAALDELRVIARRLAAHAAGFQDVLDDSDRDPWAKTVGADIAELRRMADEAPATNRADSETPSSTAPLAAGLPLVKGNCPACQRSELFLGSGGYVTCSNADCPEPDAATTVLEQYAAEAHEPEHTWAAELHDPLADEWVPGTRYIDRDRAVNALAHAKQIGPTWRDGTPTERRLVRATTTYTVEADDAPAAVSQPGKEG